MLRGIELHSRDVNILEQIKDYFNDIHFMIYVNEKRKLTRLDIYSLKDLAVLIKYFEKYPLITQKRVDFELWKEAFKITEDNEHLTLEGLLKIVGIKSLMNWGLSDSLKNAFPSVVSPVKPPLVAAKEVKDPQWLAGFTSGEGCFKIGIRSTTYSSGFRAYLEFQLTQHERDEALIRSLVKFFGCGNIYKISTAIDFRVANFSDIANIIIPFF